MITVPLKAVMAVLFVVIAVVAIVVAFVPTTLVGISSNEDTGKKLQRSMSDYVSQSINSMLAPPINIYSSLQSLMLTKHLDTDLFAPAVLDDDRDRAAITFLDNIKDQMNSHQAGNLAAAAAALVVESTSPTSTTNIVSTTYMYVPQSKRMYGSQDYFNNVEIQYAYTDIGQNLSFYYNGYPIQTRFVPYPGVAHTVTNFTFMQYIINLPNNDFQCTPSLQLTYYGTGIVCGFRLPDERNASRDVYAGMTITSATISQQISLISATENTLTTILMSATKEVVGLSWGEESEIRFEQYDNTTAPFEDRMRVKGVEEVEHPTVKAALAALGGPSGLDNRTYPYSFSIGSGRDEIYGDLNIYQDTSTGLSMYILVTLPKDDFLGSIYSTTFLITGIVCGACVLLMVCGVVFAYCLVRPLDELGERMQLTASFKDDGTQSSTPSRMSEINQLQTSFETMRDQLNTMKAYLPQSVLEALRGSGSSESDGEDDFDEGAESIPSGSVVLITGDNSMSGRGGNRPPRKSAVSVTSGTTVRSGMSNSKRESNTNSNNKANIAKRFTASMSLKTVTMVAFNIRNTHTTWGSTQGCVSSVQERYLSVILARCQEHRGVVDTFQGDRVIASLNAVRSCAQNGRRGVQLALEVVALCGQGSSPAATSSNVTAGVASGRSMVGNSGAAEMMKFNVIGPVVGEAVALERCARVATSDETQFLRPSEASSLALRQFQNTAPVFLHNGFKPFISELEIHFDLQPIDVVRRRVYGGTSKGASEQVILSTPHLRAKATSEDEWMYELADKGAGGDGSSAALNRLTGWFDEFIEANRAGNLTQAVKESICVHATELLKAIEAKVSASNLEVSSSQPHVHNNSRKASAIQLEEENDVNSLSTGRLGKSMGSRSMFDKQATSKDAAVLASTTQLLRVLHRCKEEEGVAGTTTATAANENVDGTAMWLCS